jgi:NodT family efflux transporter outer membrane factor (OMF) lipoprotein
MKIIKQTGWLIGSIATTNVGKSDSGTPSLPFHSQVGMSRMLRAVIAILPLACMALFAGCSLAPKYARPAVETPEAFKELSPEQSKETEGWKTAEPQDDAIRGNWWEMFQEPELNSFEDQAAGSNQTIAAALANFMAARAVVTQSRSQYFPTVTAAPSASRTRESALQTHSTSTIVNQYSLPFDASWEPDFWGSVRNTVNASSFEAEATLADLENTSLTVQAELAADYFQLRVLDSQKQLLDAAVVAYQESLNLTQIRHDTGIASDQDVAQAETQLNTTRAQSTDLGIQRTQLEHAIATLLGKPASTFSIATNPLTTKPVAIPFGVPSQLLERRPDIAGAERLVAAANAQIGVARAAYFPALALSGSAGYQNSVLGNLLSQPNLFWSVGATLTETLFDGGKRSGVTEQAWANYQGAVANYRQTVLTAFQDVEDNLSALRILSKELHEQDAAVASSERYLALANDRYKLGIDSYLNVITAQTTLLSNQRTAMNLRMQQLTASVQLIKALGGGWDVSQKNAASIP